MSWYWQDVNDKESAAYATRLAMWASYIVAGATTLLAVLSITSGKAILGVSGWSLLDAVLFAIIGWRISRLSRAWAIVGLCLYILEAVSSIGSRGLGIGVLTIIFIIAYINAVRGTFAYHRLAKLEQTPVVAESLPG